MMQHCLTNGLSIASLFWINVIISLSVVLAQLQNVAENKDADQISSGVISPSVNAAKSVDGNTDQSHSSGSCSHTKPEYHPYWEVDLGDTYVIDHIKIYNRLDFSSERTSDVRTELSVDGTTYIPVCYHAGQIPDIYTCVPENRNLGRWVRITITTNITIILNICEVEVMSGLKVDKELSKLFNYMPSVKGTGTVLQTVTEVSDTLCVYRCSRDVNCISVNMIHTSNGLECQLLGSDVSVQANGTSISFWKVYAFV